MIIPGGILTPCRAGTGFSAYSNLIFIMSGNQAILYQERRTVK